MIKKKVIRNEFGQKFLRFYDRHWLLLVLALVIFFAGISLCIGLNQSIWFDEAYSITLAKRPVGELIRLTAIDVHPPVYYIFLHFWGNLFGFSEFSLRSSSVIMMTLAILAMSVFIKTTFNKRFAVIATCLLCLSPMLIRYGFEVRMYALATLISILATFILSLIGREKKPGQRQRLWIFYAGLVALGMLTLYYTIVIWLTHLSYLIYKTIKERKPLLKQGFWLAYFLAIVLFSPWGLVAIKQFTNGALAQISEPMTLTNLLGVFSFNFLYRPIWQLDQIGGLLILTLLTVIGVLLARSLRIRKKKPEITFLAFLAIGPIVIEFIICLIRPMYVERYLVYSTPFLVTFIVYLFYEAELKSRRWTLGFLAGLSLIGIFNLNQLGNFNFQRMQKPDIRQVSQELKNSSLPILADSPYEAIELGYYLADRIYFYAPYESLKGGYAPLDQSEFKIGSEKELDKLDCFNYVHYGMNLKAIFEEHHLEESGDSNAEHALKSIKICKSE